MLVESRRAVTLACARAMIGVSTPRTNSSIVCFLMLFLSV